MLIRFENCIRCEAELALKKHSLATSTHNTPVYLCWSLFRISIKKTHTLTSPVNHTPINCRRTIRGVSNISRAPVPQSLFAPRCTRCHRVRTFDHQLLMRRFLCESVMWCYVVMYFMYTTTYMYSAAVAALLFVGSRCATLALLARMCEHAHK